MHRFAARLAWLAASISMIAAVVAPALHSPLHHILCGDSFCSDSCCALATAHQTEQASTSHSHEGHVHTHGHSGTHQHDATPAGDDAPVTGSEQQKPVPGKDSSDRCSLCQVLSQSAGTSAVISLENSHECVEVLSEFSSLAPVLQLIEKPFSRGPPVV